MGLDTNFIKIGPPEQSYKQKTLCSLALPPKRGNFSKRDNSKTTCPIELFLFDFTFSELSILRIWLKSET